MKKYNWGIIGTGGISNLFAQGLTTLKNANIYTVGSRNQTTADIFAEKWHIAHAYDSYEAVFADPDVDVVYIGTPHIFHFQNVRDALKGGKNVLCEKPFTINAVEARELVALARSRNLFLMDAMWNRFQPWFQVVSALLKEGRLGDLLHFKADLSFRFDVGPEHRIYNRNLGGGSLLDLGVYPIALASAFLGKPIEIQSMAHLYDTGVDDQVAMLFGYPSGAIAELGCSSRYLSKNNATLHGSKGFLEIHGMIIRPEKITIHEQGQEMIEMKTPYTSNAYQYEAQAVMEMLEIGGIEHPLMPLEETIEIMETMDQIRRNIKVSYPGE
ncbi:MAG: Gfo/Idh/MocA family oxidoreductase [FCB group bacterium]|nr:Gfo/Idh/MocA family oxidoreductase [FCB group bacterium]MBL7120949.1 Gfo/Idh/MocA family oxidoreductase [Candidatus Neomarinimicrobiota bacterium]